MKTSNFQLITKTACFLLGLSAATSWANYPNGERYYETSAEIQAESVNGNTTQELVVPGVTLGNINDDGITDIVVVGKDTVSVFLGNGDGTFFEQINTSLSLNKEEYKEAGAVYQNQLQRPTTFERQLIPIKTDIPSSLLVGDALNLIVQTSAHIGTCWSEKGGTGYVLKSAITKVDCQHGNWWPREAKSWCRTAGSCDDF